MPTTRSLLMVAFMLQTSFVKVSNAFRSSSSFFGPRHHSQQQQQQQQIRSTSSSSTALCMKTIAVFGASGLTAAECVYQALQNGDTVIGLTRYVLPMYNTLQKNECHPSTCRSGTVMSLSDISQSQ